MKKTILSLGLLGALFGTLFGAAPAKADSYAYMPGVLVVETRHAPYTYNNHYDWRKYQNVQYKKHGKHKHDECRHDDRRHNGKRVEYRRYSTPHYYKTGQTVVWYR